MKKFIKFLKELIKCKIRILKSIHWYIQVSLFSQRFLFTGDFKEIFIVCPGPSLEKFSRREFPNTSLVIFVNHAAKISGEFNCEKLFFTTDTIRASEILDYKLNFARVIAIGHFFQMSTAILNSFYFIIPKVKFDFKFGLIGRRCNKIIPENIGKSCGIGFGSLLNAINFATKFNPKQINLIGCDFGEKESKKYAFDFNGINSEIPFDDIFRQYLQLKKVLNSMNIFINQV